MRTLTKTQQMFCHRQYKMTIQHTNSPRYDTLPVHVFPCFEFQCSNISILEKQVGEMTYFNVISLILVWGLSFDSLPGVVYIQTFKIVCSIAATRPKPRDMPRSQEPRSLAPRHITNFQPRSYNTAYSNDGYPIDVEELQEHQNFT